MNLLRPEFIQSIRVLLPVIYCGASPPSTATKSSSKRHTFWLEWY